jgi:antitoxin (DNA-binding transcriptional repressor) of toxin-antitoxin stability system
MQVKTAELKANLSRYVRQVRETGESIEVLLRDETVAYLTPAHVGHHTTAEEEAKRRALERSFSEMGLSCQLATNPATLPHTEAVVAGDGRRDIATVSKIRNEKDW